VASKPDKSETQKDSLEERASAGDGQNGRWTEFVAETLLPTQQGKFRLRGYRHTVRGTGLGSKWTKIGLSMFRRSNEWCPHVDAD